MLDLRKIWAIAQVERRNTRRLVRYWVFLSIAYLFGLGAYFYYSALHALFSSMSASAGMIGPRYLMGAIGLYYLTGFVLGIVFLGFDVRARDVRDGIVEVLDARPVTNLELIGGRFIALFLSAWIPIVVLVLMIQGLGWLLPLLGSPVGRTVQPLSLFNFVFYMAVPAITFAIGLVFLVTLLVRHRLIAALVTVAAVVGLYWALFTVAGPNLNFFDYLGSAQQEFPSDIVPSVSLPGGFLHRFGFLVLGLGLVGFAAVIHPRLDGRDRVRPALGSAGLVAVGLAAILVVVMQKSSRVATLEQWQSAHAARADEPVADILSIDGSIKIDPGRQLNVELQIDLAAPPDESLRSVLMTLNPGLEIEQVTSSDGRMLAFDFTDGLLDLELDRPLNPGERLSLNLAYRGYPDTEFGYLDSVIAPETMNLNEAQVVLLGYQRGLFDRRYVALTPGLRWLPASGVDVGRDDPRNRRVDYFSIQLEVEVPPTWLAAAAGKREDLGAGADSARFRFAPKIQVPEFALMASEFESFATEIRGIRFEVLVDPKHDDNFEVLADARGEVEDWVAERLEAAANAGLDYPFDAFSVVEVPNTLRSFEGGWRLDSALAPPGMMLLRETSFPTARFDFDLITRDYDQDGGKPRIDRNRLVSFFSNDFSGGNIFAGAARSFFAHRTSAFGPDAIALDFVLEELSTLLVSGRRSYFSAHLFTNINQAVNSIVSSLQGQAVGTISDAVLTARTAQTDVWNTVLEVPLAGIDPWDDPQRTIDMLALKGGDMAEAMRDTLGSDGAAELLALLLERYAGNTFSLADLIASADVVSEDLRPLLTDWISETGLPGFVVRGVEQYRLPDDESGNARYQLLVRLSNDESVVGFTRLNWIVAGAADRGGVNVSLGSGGLNAQVYSSEAMTSDPIRIAGRSAIELGAVLSEPVVRVRVQPYLSLNREGFLAGELDPGAIPDRTMEAFEGVREIPFNFAAPERIVADDLDEDFSIITEEGEDTLRLSSRSSVALDLDQGLPNATGIAPGQWSRGTRPTAWGRYRHTYAYIGAGDGRSRAVLPVEIPSAGLWELEIHDAAVFTNFRGTLQLAIVSANGREAVSFDSTLASSGWNLVGEFRLPAGEVSVEISDQTDGRMVIADAIAWSPVGTQLQAQESASQ
jgi:ABC-type transport system involved in multi-copper enzyme maturation permease subunit